MDRDHPSDQAVLSAILADTRAGRHADAIARARSALSEGLEHPLILNLAALGLEQQSRLSEAEVLLQRAVHLTPSDIGCRTALGLCLLKLSRPHEALEQFDAALELDPTAAYAHVNRGNALQALSEIAAARRCYERALALDSSQPMALTGLASTGCGRGDYAEARLWAEKALSVLPGLTDALMSLAAAEHGAGELGNAEARVRELLDDGGLTELQRAHAQGLLGDILDSEGLIDQAFAAYSACNELLRRTHTGRYASALAYAGDLATALESSPVWGRGTRPAAAAGLPAAKKHIFVLGFPRSGTTLLEVVLAGHPDVVTLREHECLIDAVHELMHRPVDLDRLARVSPATLARLRGAYWSRVAAAGVDVSDKTFVDSCALNSLKLPLIAHLFPGAKILFACRDPRDIVLSCFCHRFGMSAPTYELLTLEGAARFYDAVTRVLIHAANVLSADVCLVRHEDMVTAFARESARVCEFLGLDWHPAMGDFALRARQRGEPLPTMDELLRGIGTEGLGRWRRYRRHLAPVRELLDPWAKRFYYGN